MVATTVRTQNEICGLNQAADQLDIDNLAIGKDYNPRHAVRSPAGHADDLKKRKPPSAEDGH
jgi:hypothetical protein